MMNPLNDSPLNYHAGAGMSVEIAAAEAIRTARHTGRRVRWMHNEVEMIVGPTSTVEAATAYYDSFYGAPPAPPPFIMPKALPSAPVLTEIDLSQTTRKGGAGLEVGPLYLVMVGGRFATGRFAMVWYGLNFGGFYDAGLQYDPPGTNFSEWQRVWRIENADVIRSEAEPAYAESRRAYAISHGLKSNGRTIDESAPLEAFLYHPKVDAMPKNPDYDDDDE